MSEKHVHQLGSGTKCTIAGCDFELKPSRFCVDITIHDNRNEEVIYSEIFGTSDIGAVEEALEEALAKVRKVVC